MAVTQKLAISNNGKFYDGEIESFKNQHFSFNSTFKRFLPMAME